MLLHLVYAVGGNKFRVYTWLVNTLLTDYILTPFLVFSWWKWHQGCVNSLAKAICMSQWLLRSRICHLHLHVQLVVLSRRKRPHPSSLYTWLCCYTSWAFVSTHVWWIHNYGLRKPALWQQRTIKIQMFPATTFASIVCFRSLGWERDLLQRSVAVFTADSCA